jgi:hypothetical protein
MSQIIAVISASALLSLSAPRVPKRRAAEPNAFRNATARQAFCQHLGSQSPLHGRLLGSLAGYIDQEKLRRRPGSHRRFGRLVDRFRLAFRGVSRTGNGDRQEDTVDGRHNAPAP